MRRGKAELVSECGHSYYERASSLLLFIVNTFVYESIV